jgi:hypothetical protein
LYFFAYAYEFVKEIFTDHVSIVRRSGKRLAREATAHNVRNPSPWLSVECPHIVPDWKPWQDSVALALEQNLSAIRLDFDSADRGMSEKQSAEDSSPCSCK